MGWVGDEVMACPHICTSMRILRRAPTTVFELLIKGPLARCLLSFVSRRQDVVLHSIPGAEIIALCQALLGLGIPTLALWDIAHGWAEPLAFHEGG